MSHPTGMSPALLPLGSLGKGRSFTATIRLKALARQRFACLTAAAWWIWELTMAHSNEYLLKMDGNSQIVLEVYWS